MKRIFPLATFMIAFHLLSAQFCGVRGPSVCTPDTNFSGVISSYNNFGCIERGLAFSNSFDIRLPQSLMLGGQNTTVLYAYIDSIGNLPCGLCWSTNAIDSLYPARAYCINISGTTTDSAGVYKLYMAGRVGVLYGPAFLEAPGNFEIAGAQFYVRVIDTGTTCPTVIIQPGDTSQTRISCNGGVVKTCPSSFIAVPTPLAGTACSYDSVIFTVPSRYTNVSWITLTTDSAVWVYDTIYSQSLKYFVHGHALDYMTATDSTGCKITWSPYFTQSGLYQMPYICIVTLDSSVGHNIIVWNRNDDNYDSTITGYNLYSSFNDTAVSPSTLIGSTAFNSPTILTDTGNTPLSGLIKYQLRMRDTCGVEIPGTIFAPPYLRVDTAAG